MSSLESQQIRAGFTKNPTPDQRPIEIQRREWEESALRTALPSGAVVETLTIDGIPCERVTWGSVDENKILLHIHGGGFSAGSPRTHRNLAARLSRASGLPLLLPEYRLAPENPFPAGVEDVIRVYRWLLKNGTAPDQIVFIGDSAGGGLVMSTLLTLRESGDPLPAAAVLISPMLDMSLTGESLSSRAALDPLNTPGDLQNAIHYYIGADDPKNPIASPIYADLGGLPPLLIHVGDHEILLSDSVRIAERAQSAGVEIQLDIWPEMWHVFHAWADMPEANQAVDQIGAWIRARLPKSRIHPPQWAE
jgi:epsilon-lactone hydrolase